MDILFIQRFCNQNSASVMYIEGYTLIQFEQKSTLSGIRHLLVEINVNSVIQKEGTESWGCHRRQKLPVFRLDLLEERQDLGFSCGVYLREFCEEVLETGWKKGKGRSRAQMCFS